MLDLTLGTGSGGPVCGGTHLPIPWVAVDWVPSVEMRSRGRGPESGTKSRSSRLGVLNVTRAIKRGGSGWAGWYTELKFQGELHSHDLSVPGVTVRWHRTEILTQEAGRCPHRPAQLRKRPLSSCRLSHPVCASPPTPPLPTLPSLLIEVQRENIPFNISLC